MPPADSQAQPPRFRLWIRRTGSGDTAFALRFEVLEGKGILRVARPGVLIDPPARATGLEERLSVQQLRTTRFILVWDGGRARQGHLLSRLDEPSLGALDFDRWCELEVQVDSGFRYLVLPASSVAVVQSRPAKGKRPSLSELRHELDSLTTRGEEDEDPDSALASLTGPSPLAKKSAVAHSEMVEVPEPHAFRKTGAPGIPTPAPTPLSPPPTTRVPPTHELSVGKAAGAAPAPGASGAAAAEDDAVPLEAEESGEDEDLLALGEAEPGEAAETLPLGGEPVIADDEADDLLALGEAEPGEEGDALSLGASEDDTAQIPDSREQTDDLLDEPVHLRDHGAPHPPFPFDPSRQKTEPRGAPSPASASGPSFLDDDEEAAFSVDLPSFRKPTEHVNVRRPVEDALTRLDTVFEREEIPEAAAAFSKKSAAVGGSAVVTARALEPARQGAPPRLAPGGNDPDPLPLAAEELEAADREDVTHRSPTTLVRHLRRKADEQRQRIRELEGRVAELEAALLAASPRRD